MLQLAEHGGGNHSQLMKCQIMKQGKVGGGQGNEKGRRKACKLVGSHSVV